MERRYIRTLKDQQSLRVDIFNNKNVNPNGLLFQRKLKRKVGSDQYCTHEQVVNRTPE